MGFRKGRYWNIVNEDIDIIRERVPDVDLVIPVLFGNRADDNVVYGDRAETYNVRGQTPDYIKMESVRMKCGRHINDIDILEKRKVCVIGQSVYDALFTPGEDPLGKYVLQGNIAYRVVGVYDGTNQFWNTASYIPWTTAQSLYKGGYGFDRIDFTLQGIHTLEENRAFIQRLRNKKPPPNAQAETAL